MRIFNLFDEKFEDMNAGLNVALMQVAKKDSGWRIWARRNNS